MALPRFCLSLLFLINFFSSAVFVHEACFAAARCPVDLIRSAVVQRLLCPFRVVKHKVFCQAQLQLQHGDVTFRIHILMFDATPEPFRKEIIQCPASAVHANRGAVHLKNAIKHRTGELTALVHVEYLRHTVGLYRLFQAVHTESRSSAFDNRPDSTLCEYQSITTIKYKKPRGSLT